MLCTVRVELANKGSKLKAIRIHNEGHGQGSLPFSLGSLSMSKSHREVLLVGIILPGLKVRIGG